MTNSINMCAIWGSSYEATGYTVPDPSRVIVEHSERAGGGYVIPGGLFHKVGWLDDRHKARLTSWLVDQGRAGVSRPEVTSEVVALTESRRPLQVYERADRLLRFLASRAGNVASLIELQGDSWGAYAWSESTEWEEVKYLLDYLRDAGWITLVGSATGWYIARITVLGHNRIAEQRASVDSSQAFIAMWFDDSMDDSFNCGMEPAVRETGFKPLRIDRKEHINKIDDEIIAEIRRSRFLVADFTQGRGGARGGVYYEAGFAHGLGIHVIYTCHANALKKLHFDTSHYNHIVWKTPADLREKLKNRILAVIGEGPEAR